MRILDQARPVDALCCWMGYPDLLAPIAEETG
jgi:hypothetical protein